MKLLNFFRIDITAVFGTEKANTYTNHVISPDYLRAPDNFLLQRVFTPWF
jgi:hypothetical protein